MILLIMIKFERIFTYVFKVLKFDKKKVKFQNVQVVLMKSLKFSSKLFSKI